MRRAPPFVRNGVLHAVVGQDWVARAAPAAVSQADSLVRVLLPALALGDAGGAGGIGRAAGLAAGLYRDALRRDGGNSHPRSGEAAPVCGPLSGFAGFCRPIFCYFAPFAGGSGSSQSGVRPCAP
jgi:hypothetical protein